MTQTPSVADDRHDQTYRSWTITVWLEDGINRLLGWLFIIFIVAPLMIRKCALDAVR